MAYFPGSVNMPKVDDGHTALHIAAANNHLDIVHLLASMVRVHTCIIDSYQTVHEYSINSFGPRTVDFS